MQNVMQALYLTRNARGLPASARRYSLTEEKALKKAAWEVIEDCADHKCGDHDLSYIPITPETLKLKNGDLMVCYGLLPDTAVQAWNILHQIPVKAAGVHDKRM